MSDAAFYTREYLLPPYDRKEILRYLHAKDPDGAFSSLLEECVSESEGVFSCRVVWRSVRLERKGQLLDLSFTTTQSSALAKALEGCDEAIVFAATVGIGIDRLITRYHSLSPAKALCFQAIGAERIEALCDLFQADMAREWSTKHVSLRPRFSPGYGDLPLEMQKDIFRFLDCERRIGVYLNESLLMSPTKSVTAIIGIRKGEFLF